MQTLANCADPLTTRGPVSFDGAAGTRPPQSGVVTGPPNIGGIGRGQPTGDTLTDYYNNIQRRDVDWSAMGSDPWSPQFFRDGEVPVTGDGNYWGGDTFYGDNYLYNNYSVFNNRNEFNNYNNNNFYNEVLNNFNIYDTYFNDVTNNIFNNNLQEWYTKTFIDQGYYDFSTHLNSTSNVYNQNVNNFAGDNVFENVTVEGDTINNNVVNEGDVINRRTVINEGDTVLNNTVINGPNIQIRQGDQFLDFNTYINNVNNVNKVQPGAVGVPSRLTYLYGTASLATEKITIDVPTDAIKGGTVTVSLTPATTTISVLDGAATFDAESCAVTVPSKSVEVVTGVTATATFTGDPATTAATDVLEDVKLNGLRVGNANVLTGSSPVVGIS